MSPSTLLRVLPLLLALAPLEVHAEPTDPRWYLGAELGSLNLGGEPRGVSDPDTPFRVFGGRFFHDGFALEGGYVDLGLATRVVVPPAPDSPGLPTSPGSGAARARARATGFTFSALGRIPLGESFHLEGRVGAFWWDGNSSLPGIDAGPGDIQPQGSVGASWSAAPRLELTAQWAYYDLGGFSARVTSVGLRFHLGRGSD
jgi:hypothetical protein